MIEIFTDGGCSGNPGPGAWAFLALRGKDEFHRASGAEKSTTNNKMELTAVIRALEWAGGQGAGTVTVSTDSQYVQLGISQWILSWEKNDWKTKDKKPVKNKELWQSLRELDGQLRPRWLWVRGHAGDPRNEACDAMVQAEISKLKKEIQKEGV